MMRPYAYLQLMRPANVATALADVLAGYAIAGFGHRRLLLWLLVSTACLYAGGVVLNDFFDRDLDRVERPERPIPSGRVSATSAGTLGAFLLVVGIAAAAMANPVAGLIACAIAALVVLYDAWGKHRAVFGPVNMGSCRALNLLLGVSAVPVALSAAWPVALVPLVYIAAVTAVSRGEVLGGTREVAAFALISLSLVLGALVGLSAVAGSWVGVLLTAALGVRVAPPFWAAYHEPSAPRIRRAIRTGVLSLVVLDAAIGGIYAGPTYSLIILATGVIAFSLARVFAVT
jgi:4-hydroxybenzoate polyprenyltransferase